MNQLAEIIDEAQGSITKGEVGGATGHPRAGTLLSRLPWR